MGNVYDITVGTTDAILLTCLADWTNGVRVQHQMRSRVSTAETGKERRRPRAASIAHTVAYDIDVTESEAEELRNVLGDLTADDRIAIPLWPDCWEAADYEANRRYDPEYVVNFTEGVGANVYDAASLPGSPTYGHTAPLLIGKLMVEVRFKAHGVDRAKARITIEEDSPYDCRIEPKSQGVGANWPASVDPDWKTSITEIARNGFRRTLIGDSRERQADGHERVNWWERMASFSLSHGDEGELLDFWFQRKGKAIAFEAPSWFEAGTATASAPHGFKSRFSSDVLDLDYANRTLATANIRLITLPWESSSSAEYEAPQKVLLFKFTYMTPTPVIWRYTDHETELTNTDGTWTSGPFELTSRATSDLTLTARNWRIRSHAFTGNPLQLFHPYGPEAPLKVTVTEADIDDLDNGTVIRAGKVLDVPQESRGLNAICNMFGGLLENPFPKFRIQHKCNWKFCSAKCGLSKATFLKTGTIASITDNQITVTTAATDATNIFAKGYLEVGDGLTYEKRPIISSTKGSGTQILEVSKPLRLNGVTDSISFMRGCDKRGSTCRSLSNHTNFGGCEFIREVNLSTQQPEEVDGGKK